MAIPFLIDTKFKVKMDIRLDNTSFFELDLQLVVILRCEPCLVRISSLVEVIAYLTDLHML
jgi:hypothetical protein